MGSRTACGVSAQHPRPPKTSRTSTLPHHDSTTDDLIERFGAPDEIVDRLVSMDPVMRELMEAAKPKLGEYADSASSGYSLYSTEYWHKLVRPYVLNAIGIHALGAVAQKRMRPDTNGARPSRTALLMGEEWEPETSGSVSYSLAAPSARFCARSRRLAKASSGRECLAMARPLFCHHW